MTTTIKLVGKNSHNIWINGKKLYPGKSQKVVNHSPDGFSWGYSGSGAAQLAFAILLEVTKNKEFSIKNHQKFKLDVIAKIKNKYNFKMEVEIPVSN